MASKTADYHEICREVGKHSRDRTKAVKKKTEDIKINKSSRPLYSNPVLLAYRIARFMTMRDRAEWSNSNGKQKGLPYTNAGAMAATGILDAKQWKKYGSGEMDHLVEDRKERIIICKDGSTQDFIIHNVEDIYLPYTLYLLGDLDSIMVDKETSEQYANSLDKDLTQEWAGQVYFGDIIQRYEMLVYSQRESDGYVKGRTFDIFALKQYGWVDEINVNNKREILTTEGADKLLTDYMNGKLLTGK